MLGALDSVARLRVTGLMIVVSVEWRRKESSVEERRRKDSKEENLGEERRKKVWREGGKKDS